jgi:hypothetical protein
MDILLLSDLWFIPGARAYAVQGLEEIGNLAGDYNPAYSLWMACRFNIPEWYNHACAALLAIHPQHISDKDAAHMGLGTFKILVGLKFAILHLRVSMQYMPLQVQHSHQCLSERQHPAVRNGHDPCSMVWRIFWECLLQFINHPTCPSSAEDILQKLTSAAVPTMGYMCLELLVAAARPPFHHEITLQRNAVVSIQELTY